MCSVSTCACSEALRTLQQEDGGSGGNTEQESAARSHVQHAEPQTARSEGLSWTACSAGMLSANAHTMAS
jgi:hypothetical protein